MSSVIEMNDSKNKLNNPAIWFLLTLSLGLVLRLSSLGASSFTQSELTLVNQAWKISQGVGESSASVPVYSGLTALLFFIFEASNFLARFLPAILGASLVILPWFWKEELGEKAALILSFGLAIESAFLLFSRTVNGGIFAIAGLLWAMTFFKKGKVGLFGFALAIAFMSGKTFWLLLVFGVLAIAFLRLLKIDVRPATCPLRVNQGWKKALLVFLVSLFLISTSFLLNPSGLGSLASGLLDFVKGFGQAFEKPLLHVFYLLLAHSYLPLFLFGIAFFTSRKTEKSEGSRITLLLFGLGIVFSLIFSRENFVLLLIPILIAWIGGAGWLADFKIDFKDKWHPAVLLFVFVVAIFGYMGINSKTLGKLPFGNSQFWSIGLLTVAGLVLLLAAWWLVRYGWKDGSQVFLLATICVLGVMTMGSSLRSITTEADIRSLEYLDDKVVLPNNNVQQELDDFELAGKPLETIGDYQLLELPDEYAWAFHSFAIERTTDDLVMIMTRSTNIPEQNEDFRGMNVVLERSIDWKSGLQTYLYSILGRQPAYQDQKGVLWLRTNLFTGAN